jgi:hypothetical protein
MSKHGYIKISQPDKDAWMGSSIVFVRETGEEIQLNGVVSAVRWEHEVGSLPHVVLIVPSGKLEAASSEVRVIIEELKDGGDETTQNDAFRATV